MSSVVGENLSHNNSWLLVKARMTNPKIGSPTKLQEWKEWSLIDAMFRRRQDEET